jgi:dTDP-4-amino-4,6-dideoxygalactose transaminase
MTCANGTCALQLAYEPLLKPGDEVLVPAWSYIATVSMVVARGCRPIFVDADRETFQIDLADAAKKLTRNTTAIAATHLYGAPVDIDATQKLAAKHGLKVIYDAAQSHLATWKGKGIGRSAMR